MNNDNNKNNIQPNYSSCSLYEYFEVLKTQETEKRVIESLKKFNGYVSKLLDDDVNDK